MRILHFIYDHVKNPWVGGGGAFRAYEMYRRLSKRHEVTVICGRYPGADDHEAEGVKYLFVGSSSNNYIISTFCYACRAALWLRENRGPADVVVEDFAPYNPIFSGSDRTVLQLHHKEGAHLFGRYFVFGLPFMAVESLYPKYFANAVCVSEASRRKFGLDNARVIPNGIDPELLDVESRDGEYIAYLGRIHVHNKGLDTLVSAMTDVRTPLRMAGRGPDERKLVGLITNAGVGGRVNLLGFVGEEEKRRFVSGALAVVLPSRYEGQGITLLEAAALGKPVIVSDIPELAYAVEAGFGVSFRAGDPHDLARKIDSVSKDARSRARMSENARLYAKGFTWDRVASEYESFLMGVGAGVEGE